MRKNEGKEKKKRRKCAHVLVIILGLLGWVHDRVAWMSLSVIDPSRQTTVCGRRIPLPLAGAVFSCLVWFVISWRRLTTFRNVLLGFNFLPNGWRTFVVSSRHWCATWSLWLQLFLCFLFSRVGSAPSSLCWRRSLRSILLAISRLVFFALIQLPIVRRFCHISSGFLHNHCLSSNIQPLVDPFGIVCFTSSPTSRPPVTPSWAHFTPTASGGLQTTRPKCRFCKHETTANESASSRRVRA